MLILTFLYVAVLSEKAYNSKIWCFASPSHKFVFFLLTYICKMKIFQMGEDCKLCLLLRHTTIKLL